MTIEYRLVTAFQHLHSASVEELVGDWECVGIDIEGSQVRGNTGTDNYKLEGRSLRSGSGGIVSGRLADD